MKYLADSDYLIDATGNLPSAVRTLEQLAPQGIGVSIVSYGEIFEGAFGFPDPEGLLAAYRDFLGDYPTLPLTDPILATFARLRSRLRQQGRLIPDLDLLIGATAIAHELTLLTRNLRHFERIPELSIYQPS